MNVDGACDRRGCVTAAGMPDAPAAMPSPASATATAMPLSAIARAVAVPARPAPTTATKVGGTKSPTLAGKDRGGAVPLVWALVDAADLETGTGQAAPYVARCGERRHARLLRGQAGHGLEQFAPPHRGIPARREAVQEPGVDTPALLPLQLTQRIADIAEVDRKLNAASLEQTAVPTGDQRRVVVDEIPRQGERRLPRSK